MSLDEYQEPKGAYYTPALSAQFTDESSAAAAIDALRAAGFTQRDIQVGRSGDELTVIVSNPTAGLLEEGRRILAERGAAGVQPYGSESA